MADEATQVGIDLTQIEQEVGQLTEDQLKEQLTKFRVRQKVQQKKHYNPENMKKYQARQREKMKLLKQRAIDLGLWDQINTEADKQAEARIAEDLTPETEE